MNITDVNDNDIEIPETEREIFEAIFKRQNELHEKYKHIELHNQLGLGLVQGPFSLDDRNWQYLIKDFAWRITEELTEAQEAMNENNHLHCLEELIDTLHFYTELLIICEYTPADVQFEYNCWSKSILNVCYNLGIACNLLKNKPWKNTHVLTDQNRFKQHLLLGYYDLISCIMNHNLNLDQIFMIYMKKNMVNQFRIRSNY